MKRLLFHLLGIGHYDLRKRPVKHIFRDFPFIERIRSWHGLEEIFDHGMSRDGTGKCGEGAGSRESFAGGCAGRLRRLA
jgi:hypothetical protein